MLSTLDPHALHCLNSQELHPLKYPSYFGGNIVARAHYLNIKLNQIVISKISDKEMLNLS